MPCLLIKPISVTKPTWVYTFKVVKPKLIKIRAPNSASGTETKMTNGSLKLSNCAARTKNTINIAKSMVTKKPPDYALNCRDGPA